MELKEPELYLAVSILGNYLRQYIPVVYTVKFYPENQLKLPPTFSISGDTPLTF